ncbi:YdcH family protein [Stenotrophomonas sp. LGBM10]|uniref:YdcH family protein n=1 Tax=Stenotrophomonas sp. LGBM10 TaxID=3390038 RepID=UPI00398B0A59
MDTLTPAEISARLAVLRQEHRALDEQILHMAANGDDELDAKRLKRRKLQLKDCIAKLEDMLIPDEPA